MQVEAIMTKQVHCCSSDDTLERAAQQMWDHDCGSLPVCVSVDGVARTIGVVTDRDICMCALFEGKALSELHVRQAMAQKVLTCRPSDSIERAESLMRNGQVRRLPVTDAQGNLAGLISLADMARVAALQSNSPQQDAVSESEIGDTLAAIVKRPPQALTI